MYKLIIIPADPGTQEILIALLADAGYEGFEQTANELKAYILPAKFNEQWLADLSRKINFTFRSEDIPDINWNVSWEAGFSPVIIDQFCAVRAAFHLPVKEVQYELIITPKMAFGTGHHATTYLMIKRMQHLHFAGTKVLDFGTGTGILAILAAKMGAREVIAVDNDHWAIENAKENFGNNQVEDKIKLLHSDHIYPDNYDIILANINLHILMAHLPLFEQRLLPGGILLMSGLLASDGQALYDAADGSAWKEQKTIDKDGWILLAWKAY